MPCTLFFLARMFSHWSRAHHPSFCAIFFFLSLGMHHRRTRNTAGSGRGGCRCCWRDGTSRGGSSSTRQSPAVSELRAERLVTQGAPCAPSPYTIVWNRVEPRQLARRSQFDPLGVKGLLPTTLLDTVCSHCHAVSVCAVSMIQEKSSRSDVFLVSCEATAQQHNRNSPKHRVRKFCLVS